MTIRFAKKPSSRDNMAARQTTVIKHLKYKIPKIGTGIIYYT